MKIVLIGTQGGHLTELMQLLDAFAGHGIIIVTHPSSMNQNVEQIARAYFTEKISANVIRFIRSFWQANKILRIEKPDIIISTGAEIAVPFFLLAKLYSIHTFYLESWCRIRTKSIAGQIIYPLADVFLVQWPEMLQVYGKKAQYWGAVI